MVEKHPNSEQFPMDDLTIFNMWEIAALLEVLEMKGILTKKEIIEAIRELRQKNPQALTPLELDTKFPERSGHA